jgi:hypothetical protein
MITSIWQIGGFAATLTAMGLPLISLPLIGTTIAQAAEVNAPVTTAPVTATPVTTAPMNADDQYRLCSAFPYNSQCKGYVAPVAIEQRPGVLSACLIKIAQQEQKGACKIAFSADQVLIYHESGAPLSVLNNARATTTLSIPVSAVNQVRYREGRKIDVGGTILNTLFLSAIGGLLFTPKKKYVEFAINYLPVAARTAEVVTISALPVAPTIEPKPDTAKPDTTKPDTTKPDAAKPDAAKPDTVNTIPDTNLDQVVFVLEPKIGFEVRNQLEAMIGKPVETAE